MLNCLIVGLGGFLGSIFRYILTLIIKVDCKFPLATFAINIIGSFLIGVIVAFISKSNSQLLLFLRVGICGGFTTFSAFTLESLELIKQGKIITLLFYAIFTVAIGILMVFLGEAVVNN